MSFHYDVLALSVGSRISFKCKNDFCRDQHVLILVFVILFSIFIQNGSHTGG